MIDAPVSAVPFDDCDYSLSQELLYHGAPYTGAVVEYGPQGQVVSLQWFRDGIPDGRSCIWTHAGQLREEAEYALGLRKRLRRWHPNGQLSLEILYDARARVVQSSAWDETGTPVDPIG